MEIFAGTLLFWVFVGIAVGLLADRYGRSGAAWFALSLLISPLLAGIIVLALGPVAKPDPPSAAKPPPPAATRPAGERYSFRPVAIDPDIRLSAKHEACRIVLVDDAGNMLDLDMSRAFGLSLVGKTQQAFIALEDHALTRSDTRPRQSFAGEAARLAAPFEARANPHGTPLSPVLVTIARGSEVQQSFGLTIHASEALAAELAKAASQARQSR